MNKTTGESSTVILLSYILYVHLEEEKQGDFRRKPPLFATSWIMYREISMLSWDLQINKCHPTNRSKGFAWNLINHQRKAVDVWCKDGIIPELSVNGTKGTGEKTAAPKWYNMYVYRLFIRCLSIRWHISNYWSSLEDRAFSGWTRKLSSLSLRE